MTDGTAYANATARSDVGVIAAEYLFFSDVETMECNENEPEKEEEDARKVVVIVDKDVGSAKVEMRPETPGIFVEMGKRGGRLGTNN